MSRTHFDHAAALAMVRDGKSMKQVGAHFGVSRQRICQIVRKAGVIPQTGHDFIERMRVEARDLVREGYSDQAIADLLEMPLSSVASARRAYGMREGDKWGHLGRLVLSELAHGRSILSVSKEYGLCREAVRRAAKRMNVGSSHGRHRDFAERRRLLQDMRQRGASWYEISREMSALDGREYCHNAAYQWASKHMPELVKKSIADQVTA